MNNLVQSHAISIFNFKSTPVRTQLIDGNIWFCLIDVCDSLNLRRGSKVVDRLEEAGVRKTSLSYTSGAKEVSFINEPNLYRLIFRSNKPAAVQFGNWVYEEVLPAIRKNGSYGTAAPITSLANDRAAMKAIGGMVKKCAAVAVRQEIKSALSDIFLRALCAAENCQPLSEVSDERLIQTLWNWYATHHKKNLDAVRALTKENDEMQCKLLAIKQAVNS